TGKVRTVLVLRDGQVADAGFGFVLHLWLGVGGAIVEIRIQQMTGSPGNGQLPGPGVHYDIHRFCVARTIDRARLVMRGVVATSIAGERAAVPEQRDKNEHEPQSGNGGAHRGSGRWWRIRIRGALALFPGGIPDLAYSD